MKVRFHINLDQYKDIVWPVLDYKPAVGEFVHVYAASRSSCDTRKIPYFLEIQSIDHFNDGCVVELGYSKFQIKQATQLGTLKNLMGQ